MAWDDDMVTLLRVMLNDVDAVKYADDRLAGLLVGAAHFVTAEMTFSQAFVADLANTAITPDPTDRARGTADDSFVNLTCLKAAAIADRGIVSLASGIKVRDGSSEVDLREDYKGKLALLKLGWNAAYEDAKLQYMSGQVRTAGAAILSPFRVFASSNGLGVYPYEGRSAYNPFP